MSITFHVPDSTPAGIGGIDEYTKLMMHGDEAALIDSSSLLKPVTEIGSITRDAAQSKFGGYSMKCGVNDYISVPSSDDFTFGNPNGSGDFTIDFWIRWDTSVGSTGIMGQSDGPGSNDKWGLYWNAIVAGKFTLLMTYASGANISEHWTWTPSPDTWYHIAVVREVGNYYFFVNGVATGGTQTGTATSPECDSTMYVGAGGELGFFFNGWLDEVRISKGIARWTEGFTPPVSAYTDSSYTPAIGGNDADTVLLFHNNGLEDGTVFTDSSSYNRTVSRGGVVTKIARNRFSSASAYFGGTNHYLSVPDSADWDYGSGDFTIDFWIHMSSLTGVIVFGSQYEDINNNMSFYQINGEVFWDSKISGSTAGRSIRTATLHISANLWTHLAFVKSGGTGYIYFDGIQKVSGAFGDGGTFAAPFEVGGQSSGSLYPYTGFIDEFRVSSVARWTAEFTPESGPYTE